MGQGRTGPFPKFQAALKRLCTTCAAQSNPTLLPPGSGASPSSAPRPLWQPSSPQGSFPSPALVLVPEAGREIFLAELVLQHLGREHS